LTDREKIKSQSTLYELGGVPADKTALLVVLKGEHYTPNKRSTQVLFDVRPPMIELRRRGPQQTEDMTGRKLGRLEVVGYWGSTGVGAAGQKWVCRCRCGMYVIRAAKTIRLARDPDDKCEHCRHLEYIKKQGRKV
jgi:hypothetical protein